MGAPILLPAAKQLKPLQQGDRDGLCCLYSIINAMRLVLHPKINLNRAQTKSLFVHGVSFLSHADSLLDTLEAGMDEPLWIQLVEELTKHASRSYGRQIDRSFVLGKMLKSRTETALNAIRAKLISGNPVLMMLWGAYDHCTVAVGITDSRLILFDSGGFRWVKLANFGLYHHRSLRCHQVRKTSVLSLSVRTPR